MRLISQSEVRTLLTMKTAIDAVERAFTAHGRGEAQMPPKMYLDFPEHEGDFRAMPAAMGTVAGFKWVNSHSRNPERHGLPTVMALFVLSDPATALPRALLDATLLTAVRTGAGAAVASKYLAARTGTLGVVGTGVQAEFLVMAHRALYETIEVVAADRDPAAAERFARRWNGRAASIAEAAASDIVCTATPSRAPVVFREHVKGGTHINAMGADAEGKQELDPTLLVDGVVFVDDWPQASHSGEINVPLHSGRIRQEDIEGSLCDVVAGKRSGRPNPDAITIFDSTGLAIQDLALAEALVALAEQKGVGLEFDPLA